MHVDESEMLRGDGWSTAPQLKPGGTEAITFTGVLPESTPAAMVVEGTVDRTLDRVEDDLVFFSKNFQIILKGGTIEKVIEKLTAESQAGALPLSLAPPL